MLKKIFVNKKSKVEPVRLIVYSFILVILVGTVLLSLPFSSKGAPISILDAAFTATSATCVTGLSLFDTYTNFTFFGQAVIMLLIQVGGLGFATFATAFTLLLRRKVGYKNLVLFSEASGTSTLDIYSLLRAIMIITFTCEIIGALLLMIRFVPLYGALGTWSAIFVSVSAFCNAGFDVLGFVENNVSATAFVDDTLVSLTISGLIFMGSLGFLVIQDIFVNKVYYRIKRKSYTKLTFHSQTCLRISTILLGVGMLGFLLIEYDNTLKDLNFFEKIIASIFQSVNTRTAGFASVDIGAQHELTQIMTIILMFIGGSPGSTAGGIKVTTFVVIISAVYSTIRGNNEVIFLNHRFDKKTVYKAITVIFLGGLLIIFDVLFINAFNKVGGLLDIMFEAVSAFGTVGLSTGVTSDLNVLGKIIVIITMFVGRVGPASLGLAILERPKKMGESVLPEGRMIIG